MEKFCLNALSANQQCKSDDEVVQSLRNLIECITYLLPAMTRRSITVIYDWRVELRQLRKDEEFETSLNQLKAGGGGGRDLRLLWITYTKNRMVKASPDCSILGEVKSIGGDTSVSGEVGVELSTTCTALLSLGGSALNESKELEAVFANGKPIRVVNAHCIQSLQSLMPKFESSKKHRKTAYVDTRGETVSPMPLDDKEAQQLLLVSHPHGDDRWAFHISSRAFYRFKPTREQQKIFHGFVVTEAEVPKSLLSDLMC